MREPLHDGEISSFLNDPEVHRDMAIRAVNAAIEYLYEVMPAAFAHQFATDARDEADRDYRIRMRRS